jgi:hypothetical protein
VIPTVNVVERFNDLVMVRLRVLCLASLQQECQ